MKSSNRSAELIHLGKIVGAHGIRGVVKVYAYTESTNEFDCYDEYILIDPDGRRQTFAPLWARPHTKNIVRLALGHVTTRDQAEGLTGSLVAIPRSQLPPLEEDTHYWVDLIGLAVQDRAGNPIGRVREIMPTGANDVYVIETAHAPPADEILLPAISSVILEIDLPRGIMVVEIPEGLD